MFIVINVYDKINYNMVYTLLNSLQQTFKNNKTEVKFIYLPSNTKKLGKLTKLCENVGESIQTLCLLGADFYDHIKIFKTYKGSKAHHLFCILDYTNILPLNYNYYLKDIFQLGITIEEFLYDFKIIFTMKNIINFNHFKYFESSLDSDSNFLFCSDLFEYIFQITDFNTVHIINTILTILNNNNMFCLESFIEQIDEHEKFLSENIRKSQIFTPQLNPHITVIDNNNEQIIKDAKFIWPENTE